VSFSSGAHFQEQSSRPNQAAGSYFPEDEYEEEDKEEPPFEALVPASLAYG
jgi:hypothetical protein